MLVMLATITAALCWTRHKKHLVPATHDDAPIQQAETQQPDTTSVSSEDTPLHPSPEERVMAMGNPIKFHLNQTAQAHDGNILSSDASIEVAKPDRSRPATERPDGTPPQRSRIQARSVRRNSTVTFYRRLVLMAPGSLRIAFGDRGHLNIVALTPEKIRRSNLPPTPRHAQFWARVRFGNTWHYPVAICGPGDTHTTAWKTC